MVFGFCHTLAGVAQRFCYVETLHRCSTVGCQTARDLRLQVVHRMGRHFGFQAFNVVPSTEVRNLSCRRKNSDVSPALRF